MVLRPYSNPCFSKDPLFFGQRCCFCTSKIRSCGSEREGSGQAVPTCYYREKKWVKIIQYLEPQAHQPKEIKKHLILWSCDACSETCCDMSAISPHAKCQDWKCLHGAFRHKAKGAHRAALSQAMQSINGLVLQLYRWYEYDLLLESQVPMMKNAWDKACLRQRCQFLNANTGEH